MSWKFVSAWHDPELRNEPDGSRMVGASRRDLVAKDGRNYRVLTVSVNAMGGQHSQHDREDRSRSQPSRVTERSGKHPLQHAALSPRSDAAIRAAVPRARA